MAKTTAQQRRDSKARYDAFLAKCPSRDLLQRLSGKWVTLVLCALGGGASGPAAVTAKEARCLRYSELSRELAGVSQKMLTQTLRSMERDGLLERTVTPTVPVTVTYELTDLGVSLYRVVEGIKSWAEAHMDEVIAHRATYDGSEGLSRR